MPRLTHYDRQHKRRSREAPTKVVYCRSARKRKRLFDSEQAANAALAHITAANETQTEDTEHKIPKRAYFCKACHGWHLTSSDKANGFGDFYPAAAE